MKRINGMTKIFIRSLLLLLILSIVLRETLGDDKSANPNIKSNTFAVQKVSQATMGELRRRQSALTTFIHAFTSFLPIIIKQPAPSIMLMGTALQKAQSQQTFDITQITNSTEGFNSRPRPSINADGKRIAFVSNRDLIPGGNADGNDEIFLFDTTTNTFTQITNSMGRVEGPEFIFTSNSAPSINSNGTRITFTSNRDLIPGGNADGNLEIFLFDTTTNTLSQSTNSMGGVGGSLDFAANSDPSINSDGTRIAFVSNRDLIPGGNTDGNREIFLFDTTTNTFAQITNSTAGGNVLPSINSDGTRIAFVSNRDLIHGGNADGNLEIFLFDTTTNTFTQITNSMGGVNSLTSSSLTPFHQLTPLVHVLLLRPTET